MTRLLTIISLAFSCCLSSHGQSKTWISLEGAFSSDHLQLNDTGGQMEKVRLRSGLGGLTFRQQVSSLFFVEAGALYKDYETSTRFTGTYIMTGGGWLQAWLFPVRAGARFNVFKKKIFASATTGYVYGINESYVDPVYTYSGPRLPINNLSYTTTIRPNLTRNFNLLQMGVEVECLVLKDISVCLNASQYLGSTSLGKNDITYSRNGSYGTATAVTKAGFFSFGTSLKYPISNFWN